MTERTPEDVVAGILRIAVGGEVRAVPTLKIRATAEWQDAISKLPARFTPKDPQVWTEAEANDFAHLTIDAILDMVVLYDRSGALGGREWLEENADPTQLRDALSQMASVAYPFAEDPTLLLAALMVKAVGGLPRPSSTNGRSRTGTSTRARSKSGSTGAS